jgi:large subunit ribosomal protein LP0
MPLSAERKAWYYGKLTELLETKTKLLCVSVDNVGSKQMQLIRMSLRPTNATVLMGKNTMIRKILRDFLEKNPGHPFGALMEKIQGNIGFVFTDGDLGECRQLLEENRVPAPARSGAIAPVDVMVPTGPTGCDPGQTSFFQVLQIATKISKGQIEITSEKQVITKGEKVGESEAALLQKLDIKPFSYGLTVEFIYDNGSIFSPEVLDITDDELKSQFLKGVGNVASLCLAINYPTLASVPHVIGNAFKLLVAVAVECENYSFEEAQPFKDYLENPEAFAAAAGPATGGDGDAAAEEAEEEKKEEEEEEVDMGGAMDMFGGGDEDY